MLKYQIFGSKSSQDYDVLVFVDSLGTIQENHEAITILDIELAKILTDKPVNANLGILRDGQIVQVFKGYPLEVNNSLYYTYGNHVQVIENQITKPYELTEDIKHYKLKRCFRFILSFYSRVPEMRAGIKEALRGTFDKRLEQLSKIDLTMHKDFPKKNEKVEDIYKVIAFQLAQTYLMFFNIEIYTKEDAVKHMSFLKPFIYRKEIDESDLQEINVLLMALVNLAEGEIKRMKYLEEDSNVTQ
jgi:hypothetical protein